MRRYVEAAVDSEIQALRSASYRPGLRHLQGRRRHRRVRGSGGGRAIRGRAGVAFCSAGDRPPGARGRPATSVAAILRGQKTPRTVSRNSVPPKHQIPGSPTLPGPPRRSGPQADPSPARPSHPEVAALWARVPPRERHPPRPTAWFTYRYGHSAAWSLQQADLWDIVRVIPADLRLPPLGPVPGRPVDPQRPPPHLPPLGPHGSGRLAPRPLNRHHRGPEIPWPRPAFRSRAWSLQTHSPNSSSAAPAPPGGSRTRLSWPKASPTGSSGPCASARPTSRAPPSSASSRAPGPRRSPPASPRDLRWSSAPHHDEPGERYAQQIAASLQGRCRIFRSNAGEGVSG